MRKFIRLFSGIFRDQVKETVIVVEVGDGNSIHQTGFTFSSWESAERYISRSGRSGKFAIFTYADHICTKTVIDENC